MPRAGKQAAAGGWGGARPGAGRKAKAVEADLLARLNRAVKGEPEKDRLDRVFALLIEDAVAVSQKTRSEARKLLLAYWYGKPVQRVLVEEDEPDDKARLDLSQLTPEELDVLERAGEIVARAKRSKGRKGKA